MPAAPQLFFLWSEQLRGVLSGLSSVVLFFPVACFTCFFHLIQNSSLKISSCFLVLLCCSSYSFSILRSSELQHQSYRFIPLHSALDFTAFKSSHVSIYFFRFIKMEAKKLIKHPKYKSA
jgi:hypothetical protein